MNTYDLEKEIRINWTEKKNQQLLQAFLALKSPTEAGNFLRDLMTEGEIKEFANRFEAAKSLAQNVYYDSIIEETGLSSATIARIKRWLLGPLGGYRLVISRLFPSKTNFHHHNPSKLGKGLSLSSH
jgi:TrpR-related protein YerC/YecD